MASLSPLIGREGERAVLADALQRCQSGRGGVVVVGGEAGVGKTRLVDEVLEDWDGDLLRTAATPGAPAYAPLSKLGLAVADGSDPGTETLDSLVGVARRRATGQWPSRKSTRALRPLRLLVCFGDGGSVPGGDLAPSAAG